MSTAFDLKMRRSVKGIIQVYGKLVTFLTGTMSYDPELGEGKLFNEVSYQKKVSPPDRYKSWYPNAENVQRDDLMVMLATQDLEFVPQLSHQVVMDGETLRIVSVTPVYSGEDIAAYELQLRR